MLSVVALMSACQPVDKDKDANQSPIDQGSVSEPVVEQIKLIGSTQMIPVEIEPCRGNGCPEIRIDRLSTNQPELDKVIDAAIIQILKTTIEVDTKEEKALPDLSSVSEANAQTSVSEAKPQSTAAQTLAQQIQPYVNNFLKLDDELKKLGVNHEITFSVSPKILNSQEPLATVVINSSHYLGGAHGSSAQHYYNYDLKAKKLVELNQLFEANTLVELKQLAHDQFKTWVMDNKLAENVQDYEQAWKFELSQNYYLGKQGLILQYQEYEIGPYVVGLPRLTIPYDQLKGVLKPQYLPEAFKEQQASSEVVANQTSSTQPATAQTTK